jgi:hypothetical protein
MVKQKTVRTKTVGGVARKRTRKTRKTVPTFKNGLLLIRKGVERSKLKTINGQANLALKLGRAYFGKFDRKVKLPASVPLKTVSGGFLISALAGIASAIGIVSGISSIVSNYKKIKSDSERLKIEKRKGELLENYFMTTADKTRGAGIELKRGKKGFILKLKKCNKRRNFIS